MDTELLRSVWQRVTGNESTPEALLSESIRNAVRIRAAGKRLSAQCSALNRLIRDESETVRALQREAFLLTGDTAPVPGEEQEKAQFLESFREIFRMVEQAASLLETMAVGPFSHRQQELFSRLACRERKHAAWLEQLLSRIF